MTDPVSLLGSFAHDLAERCFYTDFYRPFIYLIGDGQTRRNILLFKNRVTRAHQLINYCLEDAARAGALLEYVQLHDPVLWQDLMQHGPYGETERSEQRYDFVTYQPDIEYRVLRKKLGRFLPNIFQAAVSMWNHGLLLPAEYSQIMLVKDKPQKIINHLRLLAPRVERHQARSMAVIAACYNPKDPSTLPPDYDPESMFTVVERQQRHN